jgi:hypothetical protein
MRLLGFVTLEGVLDGLLEGHRASLVYCFVPGFSPDIYL